MRNISLFHAWKKEDNDQSLIKALWIFIAVLVVINGLLWIGWKSVAAEQRFYIPPDISHGAIVRSGEVPSATVYAFAYTMFTSIHTWTHGGNQDYQDNIHQYQRYLSEKFYQSLIKDLTNRMTSGGLSRARSMSLVPGAGYDEGSVVHLGAGTWLVHLKVHIVETISASVVKDIDVSYPLIVTQVNRPISVNPWGFVLSGYRGKPTRMKTRV